MPQERRGQNDYATGGQRHQNPFQQRLNPDAFQQRPPTEYDRQRNDEMKTLAQHVKARQCGVGGQGYGNANDQIGRHGGED